MAPKHNPRLQDLVKRFCVTDVWKGNPPQYVLGEFNIEGKSYKSSMMALGKRLAPNEMLYVQFCKESALKKVDAKSLVEAFPIKYVCIHTRGVTNVYPKMASAQHNVVEVFGNVNSQELLIFWELTPDELDLVKKLKGRPYAIVSASRKP